MAEAKADRIRAENELEISKNRIIEQTAAQIQEKKGIGRRIGSQVGRIADAVMPWN